MDPVHAAGARPSAPYPHAGGRGAAAVLHRVRIPVGGSLPHVRGQAERVGPEGHAARRPLQGQGDALVPARPQSEQLRRRVGLGAGVQEHANGLHVQEPEGSPGFVCGLLSAAFASGGPSSPS